jgi:gamma-glutamylcyclotransferase (GGCT)/AIG2-like uncharacterized protein YtfP
MPFLFAYGTLQDEDVQRAAFKRILRGDRDALVGFARASVAITEPHVLGTFGRTHYDNVVPAAAESRVAGTCFEITDAELASTDVYEAKFSYKRINATLASGRDAWVYVHATG